MPCMGNMERQQLEGVLRLLGGQMNIAVSTDAHLRKARDIA